MKELKKGIAKGKQYINQCWRAISAETKPTDILKILGNAIEVGEAIADAKARLLNIKKYDSYTAYDRNNPANRANPVTEKNYQMSMAKGRDLLVEFGVDLTDPAAIEAAKEKAFLSHIKDPIYAKTLRALTVGNSGQIVDAILACDSYAEARRLYPAGSGSVGELYFDRICHDAFVEKVVAPLVRNIRDYFGGDNSRVTDAEAEEFAQSLAIDPSTRSALSKTPYRGVEGKKQMLNDAKEIFKIMSGVIKPVTFIKTPKDPRADYSDKRGQINVGSSFRKSTLWHELAHSAEYKSEFVLNASKGFLQERAFLASESGKGIASLNKIYPDNMIKFGDTEIAIDDGAFSHYVTKIYTQHQDGTVPKNMDEITSSEVISMAAQTLVSKEGAAKMIERDPAHMTFFVGLLQSLREQND